MWLLNSYNPFEERYQPLPWTCHLSNIHDAYTMTLTPWPIFDTILVPDPHHNLQKVYVYMWELPLSELKWCFVKQSPEHVFQNKIVRKGNLYCKSWFLKKSSDIDLLEELQAELKK